MAKAHVNGISLHFEITGQGFPLVLSHEFAGNSQSWEPQVKFFARRYQVITYDARGYPPSDVPEDPSAYSQESAVEDLYQLLLHLGIETAHVGGLSMGGGVALSFAIAHSTMVRALVVAGTGAGTTDRHQFEAQIGQVIRELEEEGIQAVAGSYAHGPTRLQFLRKDPLGWQQFRDQLASHSALGSALTLRGVQLRRPTIYALKEDLLRLAVPTLIIVGDEDEPCIDPSLFMKRNIPGSALVVLPRTGHTVNLEEPDMFNRAVLDFLTLVDAGR